MDTRTPPLGDEPLSPAVFHILMALSQGERHGYGIMQESAEPSGGGVRMGPGTLYGTLKRLLAAGLVEEVAERPCAELGDERRRYYRRTEAGGSAVRAEAKRLEGLVAAARLHNLLSPEEGR